jgi:aryl-alcohol dehydrogenase-like predicted oxidoreductase
MAGHSCPFTEEGRAMQTRQLGETDLRITPIGIGAWAMGGGGYAFGWGPQDDAESIAAIRHAVEHGINWIDTAAAYGHGRSERVVARALKEIGPGQRPHVFTKGGLPFDEHGNIHHSLKRASLRAEAEASLRRLETDRIDLYQIHWPAFPPGNPEAPDIEEGWTALAELQAEGKLRHIGVSNFSVAQLERARAIAPPASLQPPYSMLMRDIEREILPYCAARNIGVIVYSPMASGLLSGAMTRERVAALPADDWRRQSPFMQEPALGVNLRLVERLRQVGARHGRSPAEVAIAWTLGQPSVTGAIVGARRPAQVDGFIGAAGFRLTAAEIDEIGAALPPSLEVGG